MNRTYDYPDTITLDFEKTQVRKFSATEIWRSRKTYLNLYGSKPMHSLKQYRICMEHPAEKPYWQRNTIQKMVDN